MHLFSFHSVILMFKKMYVYISVFACMTHVCRYLQRPEEGARSSEARIASVVGHGCLELGLGPLQE